MSEGRVRIRERWPEPNGLYLVFTLGVIAYTFAGFFVYWLRTGHTTVGEGGSLTGIGRIIWMAPLYPWFFVSLVGGRRPFHWLYKPARVFEVSNRGLTQLLGHQIHTSISWDDVGGVSAPSGSGFAARASIYDESGKELLELPGYFVQVDNRRRITLAEVVVTQRPDRFEALDPANPHKGCVLRARTISSGGRVGCGSAP